MSHRIFYLGSVDWDGSFLALASVLGTTSSCASLLGNPGNSSKISKHHSATAVLLAAVFSACQEGGGAAGLMHLLVGRVSD